MSSTSVHRYIGTSVHRCIVLFLDPDAYSIRMRFHIYPPTWHVQCAGCYALCIRVIEERKKEGKKEKTVADAERQRGGWIDALHETLKEIRLPFLLFFL